MSKHKLSHHLKERIQQLEAQKNEELVGLQEQFQSLIDNVKPANIIKQSIGSIYNTSLDKNIIITGITSLAAGFLTKKLVVGKSSNAVKKMFGNLIQYAVPFAVSAISAIKLKKEKSS